MNTVEILVLFNAIFASLYVLFLCFSDLDIMSHFDPVKWVHVFFTDSFHEIISIPQVGHFPKTTNSIGRHPVNSRSL